MAVRIWAQHGRDAPGRHLASKGRTIAPEAPDPFHNDMPRLTVRMVARIQGFPDSWHFTGAKTNAYRQVGNAFPPPVAEAVARQIRQAIARPSLQVVSANGTAG